MRESSHHHAVLPVFDFVVNGGSFDHNTSSNMNVISYPHGIVVEVTTIASNKTAPRRKSAKAARAAATAGGDTWFRPSRTVSAVAVVTRSYLSGNPLGHSRVGVQDTSVPGEVRTALKVLESESIN